MRATTQATDLFSDQSYFSSRDLAWILWTCILRFVRNAWRNVLPTEGRVIHSANSLYFVFCQITIWLRWMIYFTTVEAVHGKLWRQQRILSLCYYARYCWSCFLLLKLAWVPAGELTPLRKKQVNQFFLMVATPIDSISRSDPIGLQNDQSKVFTSGRVSWILNQRLVTKPWGIDPRAGSTEKKMRTKQVFTDPGSW